MIHTAKAHAEKTGRRIFEVDVLRPEDIPGVKGRIILSWQAGPRVGVLLRAE